MFEVSALVPLALLFFGLHRSGSASAAPASKPAAKPAKPAAKPAPKPAAKPAAPAAPAAPKGKMYLSPAKPKPAAAPKSETEGADQAAVNAAVSQAIREEIAKNAGEPLPAAIVNAPQPTPTEVVRSPKQAAQELRAFLLRTGRFGTLKDRPEEVKAAQRDLGLTDDGIVGPRTRAAAKSQGVTLPPLNPKKK